MFVSDLEDLRVFCWLMFISIRLPKVVIPPHSTILALKGFQIDARVDIGLILFLMIKILRLSR